MTDTEDLGTSRPPAEPAGEPPLDTAPAGAPTAAPSPPGTSPGDASDPSDPSTWLTPTPGATPPPAKPSSVKRIGLVVGLLAGLGVLLVKFVLPIVLVAVAGDLLGSVFGGPFGKLPADVRSSLEKRFEAAVGDRLEGLSEAEQGARVGALVQAGLPRLDDATLVTHFKLTSTAFALADPDACAVLAVAFLTGVEASDDAHEKVIGALAGDDLRQWFEISMQALEAETAGFPEARTVSDADVDQYWEDVGAAMTDADVGTLNTLSSGGTVPDAAACSAVRGLYTATIALPAESLALMARYDVSP